MPTIEILLPYIYGVVSILIIVLLYIAYCVFRIKRRLWKELDDEAKETPQIQNQQQYQQPQQYQGYN